MRLWACALLALVACREAPAGFVKASVVTSRDQLIGGVAAVADVGDVLLENDQVRFMILGGHGSPGPGIYGGSLADADLQRPQAEFRGGNGLDAFSELFTMVNLATPNPERTDVTISDDGSAGDEAVVTVNAISDNYMDALETLGLFSLQSNVLIRTDYRLTPGSRVLRIDTTLEFDPGASSPALEEAMEALSAPPDVFGTILRVPIGGGPQPPAPGAIAGDFLFYGNKTDVFTPGYGFDIDLKLREIFNGGCDSVNVPIGVSAVAAEAPGVSYAYASADAETYVPLFASSFTAVLTHQRKCPSPVPCLGDARFTYSRFFAVGDGDAASALGALYEAKGVKTGHVSGRLYDRLSGEPVSGARVLVLRDPGASVVNEAELTSLSPEESLARVYEANRAETRRECPQGQTCKACSADVDPYGEPGIVTSMKTDRRADDKVLDGDFEANLPPGDYLLVARAKDRMTARPVRVRIEEGSKVELALQIDPSAQLEVRVVDERGEPMPAKITIGRCLPECVHDADCGDPELKCVSELRRCLPRTTCTAATCRSYESVDGQGGGSCEAVPDLDVALGDPLLPDNILTTAFTNPKGVANVRLTPGEWEVIVSRGPEYDIARFDVALDPRRPHRIDTALHRVVDSTGWISADFHVHGINSHDANVDHETRILSMIGEGVELVSSADHDAVTDFDPAIRRLGAQRFIKGQVGLESTTVELGHFIGAPLRFDQLSTGPNLLDARDRGRVKDGDPLVMDPNALAGRAGAIDWDGLPPGEGSFCDDDGDGVFDRNEELLVKPGDPDGRCQGTATREPGIIERLRDLGLFGPDRTVVTVAHPRDGFFGYFDQYDLNPYTMVLGPGTTLELLNDLVKPHFFSARFDAIELLNGKRLDFIRTPTISEIHGFGRAMEALRAQGLPNAELEKRQGEIGDEWVRKVISRTKAEQAANLASTGLLACVPDTCDPSEPNACGNDTNLYKCERDPRVPGDESPFICRRTCSETSQACGTYGVCNVDTGRCELPADEPCVEHRGVIDDWFRLLNGGVRKTALGNSDTHGLMSVESGLPRNWIASPTDEPSAIDIGQIAEATLSQQAFTSYGPFVRLDVNGVSIGGTATNVAGPAKVHVSVESPLWFDVDRLELYRNGQLWHEVEAGTTNEACPTIDAVPNVQIVNFDCTFDDDGDEDAWYVAIALGLRGKDLRPVYTTVPILHLEIGDITSRAFGAVPGIPSIARPEIPRQNPVVPFAITNPVWLDRAGDGFDPPVPLDPKSPFVEQGTGSFPLAGRHVGTSPFEQYEEPQPGPRLVRELHRRIGRALHGHHDGGRTP